MKMTYKDKVSLLFDYYKIIYRENSDKSVKYFTGEAGNKDSIMDRLYEFSVALFKNNNFPNILPDNEWEKIDTTIYYHGFKEYDHGANYLTHYNYHMGEGVSGNGFYVTKNYNQAVNYTSKAIYSMASDLDKFHKPDEDKVLPVKVFGNKILFRHLNYICEVLVNKQKFNPDYLTQEELDKINVIQDFLNGLKGKDKTLGGLFTFVIYNNPSILANLLEVDYIDLYNKIGDEPYFIVINRNALLVRESDKNKFLEKSIHYKTGGYVNEK